MEETIVAIASATGIGARGLVRISGPQTLPVVTALLDQNFGDLATLPSANAVFATNLHLPELNARLPATVYVWPTDRSYTRQPLAEIHTLCSQPLLEAILQAACAAGARLAHPGEFTLRAFLAGRIDLPQAEAVLGIIDANDERQLQVALRQLAGGLSVPLVRLRDQLLDLLADLEAGLDFADEDISFVTADERNRRLHDASSLIAEIARQLEYRHATSDYPRVVLVGAPNAGKSSLFNALAGRDAAVVHHSAGTTRDYVTCLCKVGPTTIELIDTAGLSQRPASKVDQAAQDQTRAIAENADLFLSCHDASGTEGHDRTPVDVDWPDASRTIPVMTKADLIREEWTTAIRSSQDRGAICCSAVTLYGIDRLRSEIHDRLMPLRHADIVASTAARCRESLREVQRALRNATSLSQLNAGEEMVAAEIRDALNHLGQIVGTVYTDDLLDRIFSRFCIGK